MKTLFLSSLSLSVLALACSALIGDNRYGAPHAGNHLNRGYGHPGAPGAPRLPSRPNLPSRPASPAYSAPRNYGAPAAYNQQPAHYSAPANYGTYRAPAAAPSHYNPKRSVYQQPQQPARNNYAQQPQHSSYQQHAESKSQSHGREMKYTINDPKNRGTTHVTETHVVTNRQMHGAEAEAAMKKLMGSMGPSSSYGSADNGFQDFVKGMGLPNFY